MKTVVGVTGGIASGKSNVCSIIQEHGYEVIDCDAISKELSKKGGLLYDAILKEFGKKYLLDNGEIDRKKLGSLIFNNDDQRIILDKITHPVICQEVKKRIDNFKDGIIFLEAPLLYETHLDDLCNKVICVYLEEKYQVERLMAREGITKSYALAKIHSQMDLNIKKDLAQYIIDTKGTFDETRVQVENVIKEVKGV